MANKGLWKKELRAGGYKLLIGLPLLIITAVFITLTYDFTVRLMESVQVPEFARGQVALLKDYRFYIWSQWFGKNLFQMGGFFAILFGAVMISPEVSKKTVYFLLAAPLRRQDVFTVKYIVNYAAMALVTVISTTVLYIAVIATGRSFPLLQLIESTVIAVAGLGVVFSIAAFFSTVFNRSMITFLVTLFTAFFLAGAGFVPALAKYSLFYQMAGPGIIQREGFPVITLVVFILISAALYLLGRTRFVRKDF